MSFQPYYHPPLLIVVHLKLLKKKKNNSMHKVTSVGDDVDDDIYIMVKCMSVCMYVTFLLILPSPCQAGDIYIMMKCVYMCVSRFCLFYLLPAKLAIYI